MGSVTYERRPSSIVSAAFPVLLAIAAGLVLVKALPHASPLVTAGAVVALAFVMLFLQRPDLGLLLVLVIRSSSDVLVQGGGSGGNVVSRVAESPNPPLFVVVILAGVVFILSHRVPFLRLPGAFPLLYLMATGVVGMMRTPSLFIGFDRMLAISSAFVVYALAATLFRDRPRIQKVISIMILSLIVPALFGLYQHATGKTVYDVNEGVARVAGTFVHPSAFGDYLVIVFSVLLCQMFVQTGFRRLVTLVLLVVCGLLLSLSLARAAVVGAGIVFVVVAMLQSRRMLFLAPILLLAAVVAVPSLTARFSNPTGGSFADREELWQSAYDEWLGATKDDTSSIATVLNRLVGTGPGSVGFLTAPSRGAMYFAHNDYLGIFLEFGVLGLIAFLAMTVVLMVTAYRTWRQTADPVLKAVALTFFAVAVAYPAMYFTDNIFAKTENQLYFWTLAGLTAAIAKVAVPAAEPRAAASPASAPARIS